jgi:hypothetical protein
MGGEGWNVNIAVTTQNSKHCNVLLRQEGSLHSTVLVAIKLGHIYYFKASIQFHADRRHIEEQCQYLVQRMSTLQTEMFKVTV